MPYESAYPKIKEGEVVGWLIVYGIRGEFRAYVDKVDGYTKALNRSGDLHGRILPVVAGEDLVWSPGRGDGL